MNERGVQGEAVPQVVQLTASETHDLRRRVLRPNLPDADLSFPCDADPTTSHLGIRLDDAVVAISTWTEVASLHRAGRRGIQLRGMAVDASTQGTGIGGQLLLAGLGEARRRGAEFVWANARVSALAFYVRNGFEAVGEEYVDEAVTGLPHRAVVFDLNDAAGPSATS